MSCYNKSIDDGGFGGLLHVHGTTGIPWVLKCGVKEKLKASNKNSSALKTEEGGKRWKREMLKRKTVIHNSCQGSLD